MKARIWDMATGVGLRIGADESVAAIVTTGQETIPIYIRRESVLHMADDGDALLGGFPDPDHSHSISGFAGEVGNPAGVSVDGGEAFRAEDLVATALFCLINLAAEHLSGPAEFYVSYPPEWTAHLGAVREALDYLGLRSVALYPGQAGTGAEVTYAAALAAHTAVLATPAGNTPPDSNPDGADTDAVTTVIPAVDETLEQPPQAYSATEALARPVASRPANLGGTRSNGFGTPRTLLFVAAAALLVLAGAGTGVALHASSTAQGTDKDLEPAITVTIAPSTTLAAPPPPAPAPVPHPRTIARPVEPQLPKRPAPAPKKPPPPPPPPPPVSETTTTPSTPPVTTSPEEEPLEPTPSAPANGWLPWLPANPNQQVPQQPFHFDYIP